MLYLTTRNNRDAYTVSHALSEDTAPDGGLYVPMQLPRYERKELLELAQRSFSQNAATVINGFFHTTLDSWAVEFAIGRYPVKLVNVGSREIVAETWHNPAWRFDRLARGVEKAIRQSDRVCPEPTDWVRIGSRIAVLFGVFGDLLQSGYVKPDAPIDVAVACGDFSAPMAMWYGREMGLPIGNIVVCCNENSSVWSLLHKGEIRTDAPAIQTETPLCDVTVPKDLERLIFSALGPDFVRQFRQVCQKGGFWYLEPPIQQKLRHGMEVAVVSRAKMESTILNLYKTSQYVCDPYTSLCYSGVGEYRSKTGQSRPVLLWSEEGPTHFKKMIARCMGIKLHEINELLDRN